MELESILPSPLSRLTLERRARPRLPRPARVRVVPWHGCRDEVLVGPRRDGRLPTVAELEDTLGFLADVGVRTAVTPAMAPREAQLFRAAGFVDRERLHLLSRSVSAPPPPSGIRTSSARRWHRRRVLEIDEMAFDGFWRFDARTLSEARRATPRSRYRVAVVDGWVGGYAVCGRAGPRGYLQRLAVDPSVHGRGVGSGLVLDALGWLHRAGAATVMVNTQETNERAFGLYCRLGFRPEADGLYVLGWSP